MSTSSISHEPAPSAPATPPAGRTSALLPRVGWAVLAVALIAFAVFEGAKHGGWVAAAAIIGGIAPDLTFLLGIGAEGPHRHGVLPRRVVRAYNLAHHPLPPVAMLAVCSFVPGTTALFALGLGWLAHIAADRALGFGVRAADGTIRR